MTMKSLSPFPSWSIAVTDSPIPFEICGSWRRASLRTLPFEASITSRASRWLAAGRLGSNWLDRTT